MGVKQTAQEGNHTKWEDNNQNDASYFHYYLIDGETAHAVEMPDNLMAVCQPTQDIIAAINYDGRKDKKTVVLYSLNSQKESLAPLSKDFSDISKVFPKHLIDYVVSKNNSAETPDALHGILCFDLEAEESFRPSNANIEHTLASQFKAAR